MGLYIKKVDKSLLESGKATLDKKQLEDNGWLNSFKVGESREIKFIFNGRSYKGTIAYKPRSKNKPNPLYYQLQIPLDLSKELKKEFIHTTLYVRSKEINKSLKYNEEAISLELKEINGKYCFEIKPFIKYWTPYEDYFKRLVESNLIDHPLNPKNEKIIVAESKWLDKSELDYHKEQKNVIYYLLKSDSNEFYIGSAYILGNRVTIKKSELEEWDKFRYEVVNPEYIHILRDIEFMNIRNYACLFESNERKSTLGIGNYKLVNNKCYTIK